MLELVIDQRRRRIGTFEVGRVLPGAKRRMVGPFVFFDHLGPIDFPRGLAREADVRPHPHIGLATVTYLFRGQIVHRDSVGSEQAIEPGEMNWMIAGAGITHSERFEKARAEGDSVHGIQAWVALPTEDEETSPAFIHYGREVLPLWSERAVSTRLLAGEAFGARSPVRTLSPLFYLHWTLGSGARVALPDRHAERAAYVAAGRVRCGAYSYGVGQLLVFSPGEAVLTAEEPAQVLALGGENLGERYLEWNFVSSSRERIEQAKRDWRAGRFAMPRNDSEERIPLPQDAGDSGNSGDSGDPARAAQPL